MSKYEVKSVVCDYGVFEDNELKLICNSHANALKIKEILETDSDMSKPYVWQDKTISDLEAKLAESERKFKASKDAIKFQSEEQKEWMDKYFNTSIKLEKLEQQLAEKNARISELEDKDWHNVCQELIKENNQIKQQLADKDKEILDVKNWRSYQYNGEIERHNQDKISFAVEQLEKVEELAHNHIKKIANDLSEEYDERLNQKHVIHGLATAITDINNQIKQLKEIK